MLFTKESMCSKGSLNINNISSWVSFYIMVYKYIYEG